MEVYQTPGGKDSSRQNTPSHYRLKVWRQAIALVSQVYQLTSELPLDERFGLISQMRRSAISVPSNIAEGAARVKNRLAVGRRPYASRFLSSLVAHGPTQPIELPDAQAQLPGGGPLL